MAENDVLWPMDKNKFLNRHQMTARDSQSGDQSKGGGYGARV